MKKKTAENYFPVIQRLSYSYHLAIEFLTNRSEYLFSVFNQLSLMIYRILSNRQKIW